MKYVGVISTLLMVIYYRYSKNNNERENVGKLVGTRQ